MATTSGRRTVDELPIRLDASLPDQGQRVSAALRTAIIDGLLAPGAKLPSSRSLAEQLGVRRNAIVTAYEHLMSDGLIEARHGSGTFVAVDLPSPAVARVPATFAVEPPRREPFALGHTHVGTDLLKRLAGAVRRGIAEAGPEDLGYGDPRGSERLRVEVARHLAAHRGVRADPGAILIVNGTQAGLRLCLEALLSPGDSVWMEDPGYYASKRTLVAAGMRLVPVPVDAEGLDVGAGQRLAPRARAAYVTPSHQFPTGVTLSMARRAALLAWARATNGWIFEDDYDSEFRYAGPPLTALAGLGPERVIYLGTFTKTLFAGLRLAYAVVPPAMLEKVVAARAAFDRFPSIFLQDAVADLMTDGTLAAHTRRMRTRYRDARDAVARVLVTTARGSLDVIVPTQGLHILAMLPDGTPRGTGERIREAAKIDTKLLSELREPTSAPDGFILGISGHGLEDLEAAARRLGNAARLIAG
ncbi:MAG: PLP-dependent aminotransferase family protein [Proteobacteria bacterium]|nr:PLP-dependent aminotransferase family protein [Pseudomonadota bacterium]